MPAHSCWITVRQIHIFGKNPQPFLHFSLDSRLTFKQDFRPWVTFARFNLVERRNWRFCFVFILRRTKPQSADWAELLCFSLFSTYRCLIGGKGCICCCIMSMCRFHVTPLNSHQPLLQTASLQQTTTLNISIYDSTILSFPWPQPLELGPLVWLVVVWLSAGRHLTSSRRIKVWKTFGGKYLWVFFHSAINVCVIFGTFLLFYAPQRRLLDIAKKHCRVLKTLISFKYGRAYFLIVSLEIFTLIQLQKPFKAWIILKWNVIVC